MDYCCVSKRNMLFKKSGKKKLEKKYRALMEEARDIQRSGDLRLYAQKLEAAEAVMKEIEAINS